MVCIAAFIILILAGVVIAFLSIFKRDLGRKYLKVLKKSWHCFSRHLTFRKCDTNFQDDVKTALLKKVALKKPQLIKPLSKVIEIASVLIVVITVWSLVEGVKAGLALWTLGTCNVSHPASCALGAESCSIDEEDLNWFSEWGEIIGAIPDRLKNWNANDYIITPSVLLNDVDEKYKANDDAAVVLDVIDPGCSVCLSSFRNQLKKEDYMKSHKVNLMVYAIKDGEGNYKFKNSGVVEKYYYALALLSEKAEEAKRADHEETTKNTELENPYKGLALKLINRIFTEKNKENKNWQPIFNDELSNEDAEKEIKAWLKEWKLNDKQIKTVVDKTTAEETKNHIEKVRAKVENEIKPKGIPTMIYDGQKHMGLFKAE